jgi:hypothetical protein
MTIKKLREKNENIISSVKKGESFFLLFDRLPFFFISLSFI